MAIYKITGGTPLKGSITASGNKNAVLKLMAATLLTTDTCILENVPIIKDVETMGHILENLGAEVNGLGTNTLKINTANVKSWHLDARLVSSLRASIIFLGPMLARFGKVKLKHPGGDVIGKRAVGTHFEALESMGATIYAEADEYEGEIKTFQDSEVFLDEASVTATENTLMLAASIPNQTIIEDAACEPHIVCLAEFLQDMGAEIKGAGTNRIVIRGRKNLKGANHYVVADHVEVGTYAIAAAITGGEIVGKNARKEDMKIILLYLKRLGVNFDWISENQLKVLPSNLAISKETLSTRQKFQVRPWPGFPTDLMSPLIVLATQSDGSVLCHDWMYESRMFFVDKLVSMGANITICDPHRVIVNGPTQLYAKNLPSPDIRAGVAMVLAALCAKGTSTIDHVEHVERGYENIVSRLSSMGAQIERHE